MPHHRASMTPRGREMVVRRVVDDGMSLAQAAAWGNVSKSTVWEWVRRWRAATCAERESLACLTERSSRPRRSPSRCPVEEEQRICELRQRTGWSPRTIAMLIGRPHSTVHQVLRRGGCSRREPSERPGVVRYEWPCPGNLLHMDVKKLGKFTEPGHALTGDRTRRCPGVGWEYVHSIVDDCSRLAYSEIHDDEKAPTVTAFTRRALDWLLDHGIVAERLMTDNAFTYVHNKTLRELLYRRDPSLAHPTVHAPHQREGRALPTNPATRVGLRPAIRLKRRPPPSTATLGQPLQRAAHPQRPRQPPTHRTRSGRHRAQQRSRQEKVRFRGTNRRCRDRGRRREPRLRPPRAPDSYT